MKKDKFSRANLVAFCLDRVRDPSYTLDNLNSLLSEKGIELFLSLPVPKNITYAAIIVAAIKSTPDSRMILNEIYSFVADHISLVPSAAMDHSGVQWRNSVRHNLSVRKCFSKLPRQTNVGKKLSAYWTLDESTLPTAALELANYINSVMSIFALCESNQDAFDNDTVVVSLDRNTSYPHSEVSTSEEHTPTPGSPEPIEDFSKGDTQEEEMITMKELDQKSEEPQVVPHALDSEELFLTLQRDHQYNCTFNSQTHDAQDVSWAQVPSRQSFGALDQSAVQGSLDALRPSAEVPDANLHDLDLNDMDIDMEPYVEFLSRASSRCTSRCNSPLNFASMDVYQGDVY